MKLEFTARDIFKAFHDSHDMVIPGETDTNDAMAILLNRRLTQLIADAPVVKGKKKDMGDGMLFDTHNIGAHYTHTARLVNVEVIEK